LPPFGLDGIAVPVLTYSDVGDDNGESASDFELVRLFVRWASPTLLRDFFLKIPPSNGIYNNKMARDASRY